jgi:hypothetical protein
MSLPQAARLARVVREEAGHDLFGFEALDAGAARHGSLFVRSEAGQLHVLVVPPGRRVVVNADGEGERVYDATRPEVLTMQLRSAPSWAGRRARLEVEGIDPVPPRPCTLGCSRSGRGRGS